MTITVTVTNSGLGAGAGATISQTFTVTVTPVNQPPTLNFIPNPANVAVSAGPAVVPLTGISAGLGDAGQGIASIVPTVTSSSNANLIPSTGAGAPAVSYNNSGSTGSLTYTPTPGQSGTAVITVTVTDNGGPLSFSRSPSLCRSGHPTRPRS